MKQQLKKFLIFLSCLLLNLATKNFNLLKIKNSIIGKNKIPNHKILGNSIVLISLKSENRPPGDANILTNV